MKEQDKVDAFIQTEHETKTIVKSVKPKVYLDQEGHCYQLISSPMVWIEETLLPHEWRDKSEQEILKYLEASDFTGFQGKSMCHKDMYYGHYQFFVPEMLIVDFSLFPVRVAQQQSANAASAVVTSASQKSVSEEDV